MVRYGSPNIVASGFAAKVDEVSCKGCGTCVQACPFNASILDGVAAVTWEKCMGCGVCEAKCPNGARSLVRDERKGIPLDVRLLA